MKRRLVEAAICQPGLDSSVKIQASDPSDTSATEDDDEVASLLLESLELDRLRRKHTSVLDKHKSVIQQETFSAIDSFHQVPAQCQNVASRLNYCQASSIFPGVVIACHQIWCNRWGHCELCSGIGDRTRFLMSLVQDALDRCIPFRIDAPQAGLAMRDDVVYRDSLGLLAEWFHYRSYDVRHHRVNVNDWSQQQPSTTTTKSDNQTTTIRQRRTPIFVHMTPNDYAAKLYDPCLFHLLFRPSRFLQRQLDSYMLKMTAQTNNLISIHFRFGDLPAFGLTDYKDSRVSNLELALDKVMQCAEGFGKRLFPENQRRGFFFATDHRDAKALVKRKYSNQIMLFTTDVIPQNYRRREHDVEAWLEILILSKMKGIVMNVVSEEYAGTAGYVSFFAILAANIGFMNQTQLHPC